MGMDVVTKPRIRLTRRVSEMRISPTLAVMNRAMELTAQGVDVVDLGPGEPDFPTPPSVCEAGKRAIDQGLTKYTSGNGTKALRDALAA
ncbi:MAG TPA: aminotransferase class I/II-fold pyridoxal phosphate-dependent enzyme, partial [Thermoanaerobaculia bacterium]